MRPIPIRWQRRRALRWLLGGAGGMALYGCGGGGDDTVGGMQEERSNAINAINALPADATLDDIRYRLVLLPLPPSDTQGVASALNAQGDVVGSTSGPFGGHAFLYSDGSMRDLGTVFGGVSPQATDINDTGQITVNVYRPDVSTGAFTRAFLYSDGVFREIDGPLGERNSWWAARINARGEITGFAERAFATDRRGFLYSDGRVQDLGTLGGQDSEGNAINDLGQVTGRADTPGGDYHMFLYECGVMRDLGTLGGQFSQGNAINEKGWIAGRSTIAGDSRFHAALYRDGRMVDLGFPPGGIVGDHSVFGINAAGWVVGLLDVDESTRRGWVHDGTSMRDLNALLVDSMGAVVLAAFDINDAGQIVGSASFGGSVPRPVLLTPVRR
jgi:probable HAF family extracellular repeat protein